MSNYYQEDIICGIATGYTQGAISIVRVSGKGCIDLVARIFKGKDLTKVSSHTIHYGFIHNKDEIIDEVLVSVFKAPRTYTTEDIVEINCHGGLFVTNKIYELLILEGARPSEPGEFTKRAFLNGRIDLTRAEAVMDMIDAQSNSSLKIATNALTGHIRDLIEDLRDKILNIIANISVNIDYPEYDDVEDLTTPKVKEDVDNLVSLVSHILEQSKSAKLIKNGVDTVICGKPNVGKSSILNAIIEEQKAIVTAIPGTTRDVVEAKINLGAVTLNLIDTAGIRKTDDLVESIGIEKSLEQVKKADFVLMVLDSSTPITEDEKVLLEQVKHHKYLIINNKIDIGAKLEGDNVINISANVPSDVENLKKKILEVLELNGIENKDITYISNARQIEKLNLALKALVEAQTEVNDGVFIDIVEISLRSAWNYLGEITGEAAPDELINQLFSKFCLGK